MLARRRGLLRFSPAVLVSGVAVVSFALALAGATGLTFRGSGTILGFYSPFTRAWEFALGALLALALASRAPRGRRMSAGLGVICLGMLEASLWLINETTPFPGPWTLLPVVGTLLLILAGNNQMAISTRALSTGPMVKIGDWSYSIYLWHWPFIVFAGLLWPDASSVLLVGAVTSLVPALISYYGLEQPIRAASIGAHRQTAELILATLLPPLVVAGLLWFGQMSGWWSTAVRDFQARASESRVGWDVCLTAGVVLDACTWNSTAGGSPIYLVGDSNAASYAEAALNAARSSMRPLHIQTTPSCPFADVFVSNMRALPPSPLFCRGDYETTMSYLRQQPPGTVVIATSTLYAYKEGFAVGMSPTEMSTSQDERVSNLAAGINRSVQALLLAGHRVVLAVPVYRFDLPGKSLDQDSCSTWRVIADRCPQAEAAPIPTSDAPAAQEQLREAVRRVAADNDVALFDPTFEQCPRDQCGLYSGLTPVYMDVGHLSASLSRKLGPRLAEAIESAG